MLARGAYLPQASFFTIHKTVGYLPLSSIYDLFSQRRYSKVERNEKGDTGVDI